MKLNTQNGIAADGVKEPFLKGIMERLKVFLAEHYDFRYNTVAETYECRRHQSKLHFVEVDRRVRNDIVLSALEAGVDCIDRDVMRIIESSFTTSYNPIQEYINVLPPWDGRDRIEELAGRISADKLWAMVFRRWLLGMVAQWMQRCTQFGNSMVPVLIHRRHGTKKSSFCRMLLPPSLRSYFIEEFNTESRSASKVMSKFALVNLDEIRKYSLSQMERLKSLIQLPQINLARPYRGGYQHLERMASFIGTSNHADILTDPTGSRRFFPIELEERIGRFRISYKQLYAQLKAELRGGARYWYTPYEEALITERNKRFYRRPHEEGLFFSLFRLPHNGERAEEQSIHLLYENMRKVSPATMRDISINTFARHLAIIGVKSRHSRSGSVYSVIRL